MTKEEKKDAMRAAWRVYFDAQKAAWKVLTDTLMAIDPEWTQEALDEIDYDPTMREFDRVLRKEVSDVKKAILERAKAREEAK